MGAAPSEEGRAHGDLLRPERTNRGMAMGIGSWQLEQMDKAYANQSPCEGKDGCVGYDPPPR